MKGIMWNIPQINKAKPKDHNMKPIGLGNTRIMPKISFDIGVRGLNSNSMVEHYICTCYNIMDCIFTLGNKVVTP